MKKLLLLLTLLLVPVLGAQAQQSGTLLTTGDTVVLNISGASWASARFVFNTFISQSVEVDYTIDGTNWLSSGAGAPLIKRTDAVAANPSVVQANSTTVFNPSTYTGPSVWELPLASNVQAVRAKALSTITTANAVVVGYGLPYTYGSPVTAVLYDQTEGSVGAGLNVTQTPFDVSGWSSFEVIGISPSTTQVVVRAVDDSGAIIAGNSVSIGAATVTFPRSGGASVVGSPFAAVVIASIPFVERRVTWTLPAGGTVTTGRIRVVAGR